MAKPLQTNCVCFTHTSGNGQLNDAEREAD